MKQSIRIAKKPIHARLIIPGSKSITNRALLIAALADGVSQLSDILISDDTRAFINALLALGITIQLNEAERTCTIYGGGGRLPSSESTVWCAEAGTVIRFLLAACAASRGTYHFDGSAQLRTRPISLLLQILSAQGAKIIPTGAKQLPFTIIGNERFQGGEIEIDASETGQFVSALLMIAPYAKTSVLIKAKEIVSRPYVEMTSAMMAEFGVTVHRLHHGCFSVPVPQRYQGRTYTIEPDFSTASYFFAAAAVTAGQVTIQTVNTKTSRQADVGFLDVLKKMGCIVTENSKELTVHGPKELQGLNVDMRDFSDTFVTLAVIAPFAKTPTTITNIRHARHKESDRMTVVREN
ncbi:MAG TPA: 3-phosphoshikimate 1-carboxyvinyltransferase, partial [Gammaproteobacteria bacterium]|nr:3-phosphoshikimate 1-carboxyvinyltransferase [Gammaproteobacteria bacterium]